MRNILRSVLKSYTSTLNKYVSYLTRRIEKCGHLCAVYNNITQSFVYVFTGDADHYGFERVAVVELKQSRRTSTGRYLYVTL